MPLWLQELLLISGKVTEAVVAWNEGRTEDVEKARLWAGSRLKLLADSLDTIDERDAADQDESIAKAVKKARAAETKF